MRVVLIGLALFGMAVPASAGVYGSIEATPELPPERVRSWVVQLRAAAVEPKGTLDPASPRAFYLRQAAALEEERKKGVFSTMDLVNLSACYIRLGRGPKPQKDYLREAIRLLNSAPERNHFLVQANLASAYFIRGESGDLDLAIRCQRQALYAWPNVWGDWPKVPPLQKFGQLVRYRRCERTFLDLLEKRSEETRPGNRGTGFLDIDPIFPGLRLVGPGPKGEYEAGALSSTVNDRLPSNAYDTVLQLVLWYPQDMRLYWLLGEMLNAIGEVTAADEILNELDTTSPYFKDLHAHHMVLAPAARILKQLKWPSASTHALLLACATNIPRGTLAPPGVGAIAYAVGSAAPLEWAHKIEQIQQGPPMPLGPPAPPPAATPPMPFNWKHVLVGFAFGFLVAALLGFQWQEWRRRRMNQEIEEDEEPPPTAPVSPG
jgi:tetratricopeptide (TPR) repeat protein